MEVAAGDGFELWIVGYLGVDALDAGLIQRRRIGGLDVAKFGESLSELGHLCLMYAGILVTPLVVVEELGHLHHIC